VYSLRREVLAGNDYGSGAMAHIQDEHEKLREVKAILQRLQRIGDEAAVSDGAEGAASSGEKGRIELETLLARGRSLPEPKPKTAPVAEAKPSSAPVPISAPSSAPATVPAPVAVTLEKAGPSPAPKVVRLEPQPPIRRAGAVPMIAAVGAAAILAAGAFWLLKPAPRPNVALTPPVRGDIPAPAAPAAPVTAVSAAVAGTVDEARQLLESGRIAAGRKVLEQPSVSGTQNGAFLLAQSYDPNFLKSTPGPDASPDKVRAADLYRRWQEIANRNGLVMDEARLKRIIDAMH
jgi:hypothetical protein